ncbi:E3 ubiquitin-protein ligase RNF19B-like [Bombyx mandarina]|uniref:RBR-type E3 ubiquitin transferase n=2 Tax=Bombyx TaxID=7090 RepID=A0A8R2QXH9_BOMMO|nr:E3 ubiquitin-protein ligase RNF19B-like [Bombyx mandarina]XP_037867735.1 E3 ubiquitin-protein ligase RNF19B [Bombyx mori]
MVEREGSRRGSGSGGGGGCGWGSGVLRRLSLRTLLLDSPLVGRRLAHSVLDQGEARPVKVSGVEQSHSRQQTTIEYIPEDEEGDLLECPLCLSTLNASATVRLAWCSHRCCEPCLRQYLNIEIYEARVPVSCPVCHESIHPSDVRHIVDNPVLFEKYEEFSVRRALAADPDTRWCPAPDCSFAVVATGCASCPKLTCLAPGCGASFCYHCKAAWHPTQTCDAARRSRQPPPRAPPPTHPDIDQGEVKPCPRCSVLIVKVEDGSCNHMVCCVCGAEFCWLCMKEVSDLHYLSPSGCTFWGKKPWSRKKKLLWQLGTLAGAPLGIAVVAGVALPALLVGLPLWAGRRAHRRLRRASVIKRRAAVAAAVAAALVVSPLVASLAVGIGVPILLFYVYGVVPVSLCRAGGCAAPPPHEDDAASRRLEPSIGDASLSAGSAGGAGWAGGAGAAGPGAASLAGLAGSLQDASPAAASWPDDLPSTSALPNPTPSSSSRSRRLRSLFLYGSPTPPDLEAGPSVPPPPPAPSLAVHVTTTCETHSPTRSS